MTQVLEALVAAFGAIGVSATVDPTSAEAGQHTSAVLRLAGQPPVAVQVQAVVTGGDVHRLRAVAGSLDMPLLVAGRRVAEDAKAELRSAGIGYYDGRGQLFMWLPGLLVRTAVPPMPVAASVPAAFAGAVAMEAAIALLSRPDAPWGMRELARAIGRAPSAVSVALDHLRRNGLVTSASEPVVPQLFWELAAAWHREPVALAGVPAPGRTGQARLLQLGLGGDAGWALTDTLAARAWGMPVVVGSGYPPDFSVPSAAVLQRAVGQLGRAERVDERACTVAVAPVPLACRWRVDRPGEPWPVANHVVVALDVAQDPSRGREILERWDPVEVARVW
jgi:DNA-binding transcriptional ArsR family regulator